VECSVRSTATAVLYLPLGTIQRLRER
jgi:hypothetical protein